MDSLPFVSIVLPVYNGEKLLRGTLDSIVCQSYSNIEVVAVNSSSTDRTLEILEEYAQHCPQIKIYTIPFESVQSGARKYGYSMANGDYICCCDVYGRLHYRAVEWFVEVAAKDNYDIVVAPIYEITDGVSKIKNRLENVSTEEAIISSSIALWAKMIKRDFYRTHDPLSNVLSADDFIYHCMVLPYAKVAYCKHAVYYFHLMESMLTENDIDKMLTVVQSFQYVLEHRPTVYQDAVLFVVTRWLVTSIKTRWVHADRNIQIIKRYWPEIKERKEYIMDKDPSVYEQAELYANLTDDPMPNIVYINGFGQENAVEQLTQCVRELEEKAFYDGCKVVVLNEENCDVSDNSLVNQAYEAEDWEFVGAYWALRKIYEQGGVYLNQRIRLEAPLNYVRYFPSFFARLSETEYSDCIYGGIAGNEIIKSVLDTYTRKFYQESFYPLAGRIKNILISRYHVPMKAETDFFEYKIVAFAPSVTLYPSTMGIGPFSPLHFCYHDFNDCAVFPDCYTVPLDLLSANLAYWQKQIVVYSQKLENANVYQERYNKLSKWKKFFVLLFLDQDRLKAKIKTLFHIGET